jgi:hypothetical protein
MPVIGVRPDPALAWFTPDVGAFSALAGLVRVDPIKAVGEPEEEEGLDGPSGRHLHHPIRFTSRDDGGGVFRVTDGAGLKLSVSHNLVAEAQDEVIEGAGGVAVSELDVEAVAFLEVDRQLLLIQVVVVCFNRCAFSPSL